MNALEKYAAKQLLIEKVAATALLSKLPRLLSMFRKAAPVAQKALPAATSSVAKPLKQLSRIKILPTKTPLPPVSRAASVPKAVGPKPVKRVWGQQKGGIKNVNVANLPPGQQKYVDTVRSVKQRGSYIAKDIAGNRTKISPDSRYQQLTIGGGPALKAKKRAALVEAFSDSRNRGSLRGSLSKWDKAYPQLSDKAALKARLEAKYKYLSPGMSKTPPPKVNQGRTGLVDTRRTRLEEKIRKRYPYPIPESPFKFPQAPTI
jgi:hypothetical protein